MSEGIPVAAIVHIGCCGWSYLEEREFAAQIKRKYSTKLQAYAQLFDTVEINSTFYRLPRVSTAQKWRDEAGAVNSKFEFTVKAYQGITHIHRFMGESISLFTQLREICRTLKTSVVLFQSPASFRPTDVSLKAMKSFFNKIGRYNFTCVWEPRGKWYDNPALIVETCEECRLVHCVDPYRNEPLVFGEEKIAYFRLHGFGKPSMDRYDFSEQELSRLATILNSLPPSLHHVYILFNNVFCYENATGFRKLLNK
jgi:uncharacterized protein YecE (DUF72 family)